MGTPRAWIVWGLGVLAYLVAVFHRTSLSVAGVQATERFSATSSQLAMFGVVQLLIYALMQVPVGVLLDKFGSRRLIVAGAVFMAGGQLVLALAESLPMAIAARVLVGIGDAMTFISVIRLVPAWFPPPRTPMLTQVTGQIGQLGQVASALPFAALLHARGWTAAYSAAAAVGVLVAILVLVGLRSAPAGVVVGNRGTDYDVLGNLQDAWRNPGTRLGLWLHFTVQFSGMVFVILWGFPFMVTGLGLSETTAGALLTLLVIGGMISAPILGRLTALYPLRRSNLILGVVTMTAASWTLVLLWPGPVPFPMVVVLVLVLATNGPAAMVGFDFARTFNPQHRLGSATGIVNVGGFAASVITILMIGLVLDVVAPDGPDLTAYKIAFSGQYVLWLVGVLAIMRSRRDARRALAEEGTIVRPLVQVFRERRAARRQRL